MELEALGKAVRTSEKTVMGMLIRYSLFKSDKRIGHRYSYSIALEEISSGQKDVIFAGDISRIKKRSYEIFRMISDGSVTACTFFEVIEDLL